MHDWSDVELLRASADLSCYIQLPEDGGWGVLIAWCAGHRARYRPIGRRTSSAIRYPGGERQEWPRKQSEQREMDEDVREYCAAAGIPPPPPSREWWVVRPNGLSDDEFFSALNDFVRKAPGPTPAADREAVGAFLKEVFT